MRRIKDICPSVSGRLSTSGYGSHQERKQSEGAKNPRSGLGYHKRHLTRQRKKNIYIRTYKIRTMKIDENLLELEKELELIHWDIIGLQETSLRCEKMTEFKSEHVLFQNSTENSIGEVTICYTST